jgi:hypothetical protein
MTSSLQTSLVEIAGTDSRKFIFLTSDIISLVLYHNSLKLTLKIGNATQTCRYNISTENYAKLLSAWMNNTPGLTQIEAQRIS